ncbi:MAG TPA: HAD-IA family hydrolase [Nitrososphaeraceae archaeon]
MKAIVFDSDGVLVDSMPSHYEAWKTAFKEVSNIDVDERTIYLLEGMRGIDLVEKVFELKKYPSNNHQIAEQVNARKNEVFRDILLSAPPRAYQGVKELILKLGNCKKAVVSGSAREDVETLLEKSSLGKENNLFDILITADDSAKGKPDPCSFMAALDKIKIFRLDALIVENAPLGVEAANKAGIQCIVTLNNTPLNIEDFKSLIDKDRILKETRSATTFIEDWCNSNNLKKIQP